MTGAVWLGVISPMKFNVRHTFKNISREEYEKIYFNEPFNEALCAAVNLGRVLETLTEEAGVLKRSVRVAPQRDIPAPVAKVIGADRIEYVEHITYPMGSYRGTWDTVPGLLASKLISVGTFGFDESPEGVVRWIEGDINVKIFGIGSMIEKIMVSEVEKSYDDAAKFTQAWLNDGGMTRMAEASGA